MCCPSTSELVCGPLQHPFVDMHSWVYSNPLDENVVQSSVRSWKMEVWRMGLVRPSLHRASSAAVCAGTSMSAQRCGLLVRAITPAHSQSCGVRSAGCNLSKCCSDCTSVFCDWCHLRVCAVVSSSGKPALGGKSEALLRATCDRGERTAAPAACRCNAAGSHEMQFLGVAAGRWCRRQRRLRELRCRAQVGCTHTCCGRALIICKGPRASGSLLTLFQQKYIHCAPVLCAPSTQ